MTNKDIDHAVTEISRRHPSIEVEQLRVLHPADDDGIWSFRLNGVEVQAESSTGNCPFLVESTLHPNRRTAEHLSTLIALIESELDLRDGQIDTGAM